MRGWGVEGYFTHQYEHRVRPGHVVEDEWVAAYLVLEVCHGGLK